MLPFSGNTGSVLGMKVVVNPHLPRFKNIQFRFPRSKRRRIQKKWSKRNSNYRQVKSPTMFVCGDTVILHPEEYAALKELTKKAEETPQIKQYAAIASAFGMFNWPAQKESPFSVFRNITCA